MLSPLVIRRLRGRRAGPDRGAVVAEGYFCVAGSFWYGCILCAACLVLTALSA